jgi:two-component system chemotaxis response regulator CheB
MSEVMGRDIIVIGASAGGVPVLQALVNGFTSKLNAAVFIVLHTGGSDPSRLAQILQRRTRLGVTQAEDGEPIRRGHIYVLRPDYHLILEAECVRLTRGPKENRYRPSIDALFRSAAYVHGARVMGVVLTGTLDDGTAGLWWIKRQGGLAVVQDPGDAEFPSMPVNALGYVTADHVVAAEAIAPLLTRLAAEQPAGNGATVSRELEIESRISLEGRALQAGVMELGPISPYTCPECQGVLVQLKEGGVPRFRCHTGHAYSINTLLAHVTEHVESSLWGSIRAIEESALMLQEMAREARADGKGGPPASQLEEKARDTLKRADLVRRATQQHQTLSKDNVAEVKPTSR